MTAPKPGSPASETFEIFENDRVTGELDRRIRETLAVCFPDDAAHFLRDRSWNSRPAWVVVMRDPDGAVTAHCAMVVRTVMVDGDIPVTVAGVQGFSVLPRYRGTGLSDRLMERALAEARARNIEAGLLFCLPALEKVYARTGWRTLDAVAAMRGENGESAPIPGKNIVMAIPLSLPAFPAGDIDLMGPDW